MGRGTRVADPQNNVSLSSAQYGVKDLSFWEVWVQEPDPSSPPPWNLSGQEQSRLKILAGSRTAAVREVGVGRPIVSK